MSYFTLELLRSLVQPIFIFLTILSFSVNILGACAFYYFENASGYIQIAFLDAVYFAITTTTGVGYGDISPLTPGGKVVAIGLMLSGTAIFAAFTATLAATLLELEIKRRAHE